MASLAVVGAIPELLYGIIENLNPKDTVSLLLTCKTFYPACHRYLWTNLRLYSTKDSDQDSYSGISDRIVKTLAAFGVEGSGLKYTRSLRLHQKSLANGNEFITSGLSAELGLLLATGQLDLNCIELTYPDERDGDNLPPESLQFLHLVRDYSLSKGSDNFSFVVTNYLAPTVVNNLPVERITDLRLLIDWDFGEEIGSTPPGSDFFDPNYDDDPDYDNYESDDPDYLSTDSDSSEGYDPNISQWNKDLAVGLTKILSRAANLRYLCITTESDFGGPHVEELRLPRHLAVLRDTIKNLPKLHTLEIYYKFFHPSFFVVPPESARRVIYEGFFSDKWFRKFARCPFTNVRNLRVRYIEDSISVKGCRDFSKYAEVIEDVKFTGLQECKLVGLHGIVGLERAILKRNPGLHERYKRHLSYPVLKDLQEIAVAILMTASADSLDAIKNNPAVRENVDKAGEEEKEIEINKMVRECLQGMPKNLEELKAWNAARDRAQTLADGRQSKIQDLCGSIESSLESILESRRSRQSESQSVSDHTQKLLDGPVNGEQVNVEMDSKDYLKIIVETLKAGETWTSRQAQASDFWEICRNRVEEQVRACTKLWAKGRIIDSTESDNELAERLTQECAERLGSSSFS